MAKQSKNSKKVPEEKKMRRSPPAMSIESRENQLIAQAVDLAEKQIRNGTASSQIIYHFLKAGSTKEQLEKERLKQELDLMKAKIEVLRNAKNVEELYKNAIDAMKSYSGLKAGDSDDPNILGDE